MTSSRAGNMEGNAGSVVLRELGTSSNPVHVRLQRPILASVLPKHTQVK